LPLEARLVIFDCDGVLVDSEPIANRIFTDALNEVGLRIGYEEVCRDFVGLSMAECLRRIEQRLGGELPPHFEGDLQQRTFEAFRRELKPVPGVRQALRQIDLPCCVASSGEQEKIRLSLGLTCLLDRFEGRLFSATEVERGKPHPDLFVHAARSMNAPPQTCIVVEDSVPGVQGARAAGMRVLGFAAHGNGDELARAGATVFHDMRSLPALIAKRGHSGS